MLPLSVTYVCPSVRLSVPLSCPSHNSKTLWNIFMKLHRCIHHNKTMCHEQGRQLLHFWFFNYFPLTKFHIVNRVRPITPKPYGIYSWNFTSACIILIRCVMNKEDNSCIFGFWIISPLTRFHIVNRVQAITPKLYGIYSWNFTSACITLIQCVMNKEDNSGIFCFWIIFPCLSCI